MVYQRILSTDLKQNLKQNPETESETLPETIVRQGPENKAAAKIHCHVDASDIVIQRTIA